MNKKPGKPSPDFPLTPHASGKWCKKVKGKIYYFGSWDDPQAALEEWLDQKDYLLAGRPIPKLDGHSVLEVCDRFLKSRKADLEIGELSQRTYDDYKKNCELLVRICGGEIVEHLAPEDWQRIRGELATGVGTTTLANRVRMARVALNYLDEICGVAPKFGKSFREPSARAKRKAKAEAGERIHTREQILAAIEGAKNPQVKAMILLGINCGFGNEDCSELQWGHLDLDGGWYDFARSKTYVPRKAKLWPETIDVLRQVEQKLPDRVFVTKYGNPWSRTAIHHEVAKLGLIFYNLRRTFRTVADETLEVLAIRLIMGHASSEHDMDARYTRRIKDERLKLVADYVHAWLYGES
jgi:integrase